MRLPILCCLLILRLFAAQPESKEFSIVIDKPQAEYTVETGGTIEPENVEIIIENLGGGAVVNPRMTVNGLYDWYDVNAIVAEATRGAATDEEKAFALWSWVLYKRFQLSPNDRSALHPVRAMNGYGYGICGHTSAWLKALWTAAGLKARVQELWGHTVSEVYYDGAWHLFDGNVKVFYPGRDNRTVASLEALERDEGLIARGIHPRDPWLRRPDTPSHNQELVRYIAAYKDNYEEHSYDDEIARPYNMAMTLRPGEKLVRWWEPRLGKFEARNSRKPERYANGQLTWQPDLARIDVRPYLSIPAWGNIATRPSIRVAELQDKVYTRPAVYTVPVASPYPVIGGRFQATVVKQGSSELDLVSIFFGEPNWRPGDLFDDRGPGSTKEIDLDLDPHIRKAGALYRYSIGFAVSGNAEAKPPTQSGVDAFRVVTDLQVSPHSLPALSLGRNTVRFWNASTGPVRVRITHRWREIRDRRPPAAVEAAMSPADGRETATLAPTLQWTPVGKTSDYQVLVSLRPDCRWPVSPALHQSTEGQTKWTVPAGLLNPGTTYYWRVRARDQRGDIGAWSRSFRFRTADAAK